MALLKNNAWKFLSALVGLEACLVIAGWIFAIDRLTRFLPNQINMKFPTAVAFLLSAIALPFIAQALQGKKEAAQVVLPATTLFIFLIMATLLAGGILNIHTGIENLFVQDAGSIKTVVLGMPAIPTMIAFIIFGLASLCALFDFQKLRSVIFSCGCAIALVGIVAIVGYIIGIPFLYYQFTPAVTPMAVNSGLLFLLLGGGLMSVVAQRS